MDHIWAFFSTMKLIVVSLWKYGLSGALQHIDEELRKLRIENIRLQNLKDRRRLCKSSKDL